MITLKIHIDDSILTTHCIDHKPHKLLVWKAQTLFSHTWGLPRSSNKDIWWAILTCETSSNSWNRFGIFITFTSCWTDFSFSSFFFFDWPTFLMLANFFWLANFTSCWTAGGTPLCQSCHPHPCKRVFIFCQHFICRQIYKYFIHVLIILVVSMLNWNVVIFWLYIFNVFISNGIM